jgi:redox-sensitive bicupin YhaK (pirin superfamily)
MSRVTRRETLKLIAAAGTAATGLAAVACAGGAKKDAKTKGTRAMKSDGKAMASPDSKTSGAILSVTPLGFPWRTHDPFLFCVHHDDHYPAGNEQLGPAASLAGRNLGQDFKGRDGWRMYHGEIVPGFPQHPHRGFETVTVVRRGLLDHSDSLGATARYGEGDVQWLTAGGGILHAEMFPLLERARPNPLELFQIWLNLPAAKKMVAPHFAMLWSPTIPRPAFRDDDGRPTEVALVAGRLGDVTPPAPPPSSWAAAAEADVAIWTIKMAPGARWSVPAAAPGSNRSLYFFRGAGLRVGGREIPPSHEVEVRGDRALTLEAGAAETELLLLQGRPIGEPVVQYGPFVMNTRDEIQQAFADYQRTQFGGWPWPSHEPVHARAEGRFARRPDGRVERPG